MYVDRLSLGHQGTKITRHKISVRSRPSNTQILATIADAASDKISHNPAHTHVDLVKTRSPVKRTSLPTRCLSRQAGVKKEWCQRAEARRGRNFGHATSSTSRAVNRVYTLFHDIDGQRACRDNNTTTGCPDNRLGGRVLSVYNRQCHSELLPGLTRSLACFRCPARHYRRVQPDPLYGASLF